MLDENMVIQQYACLGKEFISNKEAVYLIAENTLLSNTINYNKLTISDIGLISVIAYIYIILRLIPPLFQNKHVQHPSVY